MQFHWTPIDEIAWKKASWNHLGLLSELLSFRNTKIEVSWIAYFHSFKRTGWMEIGCINRFVNGSKHFIDTSNFFIHSLYNKDRSATIQMWSPCFP